MSETLGEKSGYAIYRLIITNTEVELIVNLWRSLRNIKDKTKQKNNNNNMGIDLSKGHSPGSSCSQNISFIFFPFKKHINILTYKAK